MSPVPSDFQASLDALGVATTKAGTGLTNVSNAVDQASIRIAAVMDTLKTRMTDAEVAAAKQVLDTETNRLDQAVAVTDGIVAALNGMAPAATPTQPNPEPIPVPVPEPAPIPDTPVTDAPAPDAPIV